MPIRNTDLFVVMLKDFTVSVVLPVKRRFTGKTLFILR